MSLWVFGVHLLLRFWSRRILSIIAWTIGPLVVVVRLILLLHIRIVCAGWATSLVWLIFRNALTSALVIIIALSFSLPGLSVSLPLFINLSMSIVIGKILLITSSVWGMILSPWRRSTLPLDLWGTVILILLHVWLPLPVDSLHGFLLFVIILILNAHLPIHAWVLTVLWRGIAVLISAATHILTLILLIFWMSSLILCLASLLISVTFSLYRSPTDWTILVMDVLISLLSHLLSFFILFHVTIRCILVSTFALLLIRVTFGSSLTSLLLTIIGWRRFLIATRRTLDMRLLPISLRFASLLYRQNVSIWLSRSSRATAFIMVSLLT